MIVLISSSCKVPTWHAFLSYISRSYIWPGQEQHMMCPSLYQDFSKYNQLETQEETQEETGWKLVRCDVLRPPVNSDWLCVCVGTGVQFLSMMLVAMVFAVLGLLSPSNTAGVFLNDDSYALALGFHGFACCLLFFTSIQVVQGLRVEEDCLLEDIIHLPWQCVGHIFFFLDILIWGAQVLWCSSIHHKVFPCPPLVWYLGAFSVCWELNLPLKTLWRYPGRYLKQAWYMNLIFSILIGGILPFGVVFIELFFIPSSIWLRCISFTPFLGFSCSSC